MTRTDQRASHADYLKALHTKARTMGSRVPSHYYLPALGRMISAGQEASAIATVRAAFMLNPETEFKQSFHSWSPRTAREIIHWEIVPTIHERINIRGLMVAEPNRSS